jgi:hypothetical protein
VALPLRRNAEFLSCRESYDGIHIRGAAAIGVKIWDAEREDWKIVDMMRFDILYRVAE